MAQENKEAVSEAVRLKTPPKYHVIMLNDDATPMEFVIQTLITTFNKVYDEASAITLDIHENGRGIAGTYSYEVAEQKCIETITEARQAGFPLDVVVEEVE